MVSREEVEKIARLARLTLTVDEIEVAREEMNRILRFVEVLNDLDLSEDPIDDLHDGVHPTLRDDIFVKFPADCLIAQATSIDRRLFEVPYVIEEEEP